MFEESGFEEGGVVLGWRKGLMGDFVELGVRECLWWVGGIVYLG